MMRRRVFSLLMGLGVVAAIALGWYAWQDEDVFRPTPPPPAEEAVFARLDRPAALHADQISLAELAAHLAEAHALRVLVDDSAAGIDRRVTLHYEALPLRGILTAALARLDERLDL